MNAISFHRFLIQLSTAGLLLSPLSSQAEDHAVLIKGAQGVTVSVQDLRNEMERMPTEVQVKLLTNQAQIQQLLDNIYLRRAAALDAEKTALDKLPATQAKLKQARENVLAEAWMGQVDASVKPNENDLETYARATYKAEPKRFENPEQFQARHILVMGASEENKAKAEKLLAELKAGASFEELAKQHSGDPGSAAKGGDLGWFPMGRMVKEFDETLGALKSPGELSGVVQTRFGYHIIKLEGRKPAKMKEFSEVRTQLHAEAKAKLTQEARDKAIGKLRSQARGDADALKAFIDSEKAKRN